MRKKTMLLLVVVSMVLLNGCRNADKKTVSKLTPEIKTEAVLKESKSVENLAQEERNKPNREEQVVPKTIEVAASNVRMKDSDGDKIPDKVDDEPRRTLKETLRIKGSQNLVILDNIKFNSDELSPSMLELLNVISEILKNDREIKIKIVGHTCDIGTEANNLKLSKKRALSAEKYLLWKGANKGQVLVQWKGEKEPVEVNADEEKRSKNRRIQIVFYENENKISNK